MAAAKSRQIQDLPPDLQKELKESEDTLRHHANLTVFQYYDLYANYRHLVLLCDVMTAKGDLMPFKNRQTGIFNLFLSHFSNRFL
jgi:hypothetical protein